MNFIESCTSTFMNKTNCKMTLRQSGTFHDHYTTKGLKDFSCLPVHTCKLENCLTQIKRFKKISKTNKKKRKSGREISNSQQEAITFVSISALTAFRDVSQYQVQCFVAILPHTNMQRLWPLLV